MIMNDSGVNGSASELCANAPSPTRVTGMDIGEAAAVCSDIVDRVGEAVVAD